MVFFEGSEKKLLILQKIFYADSHKLEMKVHVKDRSGVLDFNWEKLIEIFKFSNGAAMHPEYISYELRGTILYYIKQK